MTERPRRWDVFISHASEDKDAFVRPLAVALRALGASVWYDEFSLEVGDSISRSIDRGLAESAYGIAVISPAFIGKRWPEYELRGLVSREVGEDKVILPIWHGVTREQVVQFSPTLADKLAIDTSGVGSQEVAIQILKVVRADLYKQHPRAELLRLASGTAVEELQREIERVREELVTAHEELSRYRCPYCQSPIVEQVDAPADPNEKHWDVREVYECGYQSFSGYAERPCPSGPDFPKFEDYDLQMHYDREESQHKWQCHALPKTDMARRLSLAVGFGRTQEEAKRSLRERYDSYARKYGA